MLVRRIVLTVAVLAVVAAGYFAAKWVMDMTTPLSPAAARLVGIFEQKVKDIPNQRVPLVIVEDEVCSHFSIDELDAAVAGPIPFFQETEKREERGNLVWHFGRRDFSGYYLFRIVIGPAENLCQASITKVG